MKKNILLIFFIIFLFTSCNKKTIIDKEIESLEIKPTNFSSVDTVLYTSKKIKSLRLIVTKTEYLDVSFYESGKKKSIGHVKNSQCHDKYIDWYENGKIKWTREYNYGNQIGKSIEYQQNGNLKQQFDNEKKETTTYWKNGKSKFKFAENCLQYYYYYNGNPLEKHDKIKKDERFVKYFNENGKIAFSGDEKSGLLYKDNIKYNGKIICYFNNGKISHYEEFINGLSNGKSYGYYGNGILKFEGEFANGKTIFCKGYYENGKLSFIQEARNNKLTHWDEKGSIINN